MEIIEKRYPITYADGTINFIPMLSAYDAEVLKCRYNDLLKFVIEIEHIINNNEELLMFYYESEYFKKLIDEILEIFKLDINKIEQSELFSLILPYEKVVQIPNTEEYEKKTTKYGKLLEFVFDREEETESNKKKQNKIEDICESIGSLWAITKNMQDTLFILKTFSNKDINMIMKTRNDLETPAEEKMKRKAQDKAKETIKKLSQKREKTQKIGKKQLGNKEVDRLLDQLM